MASGDVLDVDDNPALEPLLQCTICMDRFDQPKLLPCGHTFCLRCIEGLLYSNTYHVLRNIACPVCRKESRIPNAGPHTLQDDFRVEQIRDAFTIISTTPAPTRQFCDVCRADNRESSAEFDCLNCHKLLCAACVDKHNSIPSLASHTVITKDDQFGKVICKTHKENCAYVCNECARLVCVTCLMTSCEGHHCADFPSVTNQLRSDVIRVTKDVDYKLEQMQQSIDLHSLLHEEQVRMFECAETTLQEHTVKLISIIEGNSQQIKQTLNEAKEEILGNIRDSREETEEQLRVTRALSNLTKGASGSGMDPQMLALLPSLSAMISKSSWKPTLPRASRFTVLTEENLTVGTVCVEEIDTSRRRAVSSKIKRTLRHLEVICNAVNKFFVLFLILSILASVLYAQWNWWREPEVPEAVMDSSCIQTPEPVGPAHEQSGIEQNQGHGVEATAFLVILESKSAYSMDGFGRDGIEWQCKYTQYYTTVVPFPVEIRMWYI